jgi:hypothetical protein
MKSDLPDIPKIQPEKSVLVPESAKMVSEAESTKVASPVKSSPVPSAAPTIPLPKPPNPNPAKMNPWMKVGVIVSAVIIFLFMAIGIPAFLTYQKGMALYAASKKLSEAGKSQDLGKIKSELAATKKSLASFKSAYTLLSWTRIIPYFGGYVSDLGHAINAGVAGMDAGEIVLTTVEPYADILGFKGAQVQAATTQTDGEKTAQERIDFLVQSLPSLLPQIDKISAKAKIVRDEISLIDAERYPENYKGKVLRANIKNTQYLIDEATNLLVNGKPVIEAAPFLLGMDSPRAYLLLFQNDKELRPTGGFMTGYAIMKVDKAKFNPVTSDDIYNLDAQYKPSIPAPDPIVKYIKGPYVLSKNLRLRDMNWSPDFAESMKMVTEAIKQVGIANIDGIIAVDTQLLTNLLDVIGPIGVPGFGNFNTKIDPECKCPQVIHELEAYADVEGPIIWDPLTGKIILKPKNADNRKRIIGPLMNSILANAMGQPKEKLPGLFEAGIKSLLEKHVLFFLYDQKYQSAVSDFGLGGKIRDYEGDYLHINDANLGGRKSNLYATEEVEQDIKVARDGSVTKTVTITYKNPEKQDGWLNSVLPTWVRVYVPKGSTLIDSAGLEAKAEPYEDLGKTVFAGFFQLRPEGVSKVTFQYKLPMKFSKDYKLLIQKQPGTDGFLYTIKLGKNSDEFFLKTDKEIKIGL